MGADRWLMQLGTLSGNPVAAVAGFKTQEVLRRKGQHDRLRDNGRRLMRMASEALKAHGIPHRIIGDPTLFEIVFTADRVRDYRDVFRSDTAQAALFNRVLVQEGLFKSPGRTYPSLALTEEDFDLARTAYAKAAAGVGSA